MKFLALLPALFLSLSAHAFDTRERHDLAVIKKALIASAKADITGKGDSIFGGAVRALHDKMSEDYGGRFSPDSMEVSVSSVNFSFYRAPAKYCNGYADKDGNLLPEETEMESPKAVYRVCNRTETFTYLVTVSFDSSTSGSVDREGVAFKMVLDDSHSLMVKKSAGYHPLPSEIFRNSFSSTITTMKVEL